MKHVFLTIPLALSGTLSQAESCHTLPLYLPRSAEQTACLQTAPKDSLPVEAQPFKAHLVNDEYQVWFDIDFYNNQIIVPGQDIFGKLPGYFGAKRDTRKWIISEASIKGNTAKLLIINDYGSEDLTAELKLNKDGSYTFTQLNGSTIKIVVNRKWVKIPKELVFKKQ